MKLVLATNNQGKVKELRELLKELPIEIMSLQDFPQMPEVEEDGQTFQANALKKAREVAEYTGLVAMADDSGLEVDYLERAPGVYSARFAGEPKSDDANNQKLLSLLSGVADEQRAARFRCAIAIYTPAGEQYLTDGSCEGRIGHELQGNAGFGYDPLFYLPQYDQTFAEIPLDLKNQISHRGKATAQAIEIIKKLV